MRARHCISVLTAAFVVFPFAAIAQGGSTVKLLVGFPAGGAPDAVARAVADQWRIDSGHTIVVENKPGASGKIAIDTLLAASPDGNTVALVPSSILALLPQTVRSAKFNGIRDFVALGSVAEYGFGVAAGPASKAMDVATYKAWAKANPRHSSFATPGVGTPQHFLGEQLQKALEIELTHVPYKGGANALSDVIGGTVPLMITTEQLLVPHESQGKLRTLFITSGKRNPSMPNVPTAREVGLPQLEATDWFGVFAKAGTPINKVTELRAALAKAVAAPAYGKAVSGMGYTVPMQQPADFAKLLREDQVNWTNRVKLANFQAAD